jgi:hypothetical protein
VSHFAVCFIKVTLEQQAGERCPFIKYQFQYFSMMQQSLVVTALVVNM